MHEYVNELNSTNYLIKITKDLLPFQNETLHKKRAFFTFSKKLICETSITFLSFFSRKKIYRFMFVSQKLMNI